MPWRRSVAGASIRGHGVDLCRRRSIRAAGASIPATAASIRAAPTTMASIRGRRLDSAAPPLDPLLPPSIPAAAATRGAEENT